LASVTPDGLAKIRSIVHSESFLGEWTATAHAPGGEVSETLSVTKTDNGYAITAKLVGPNPDGMPEAGPGTDIVLDGGKFFYKRTVTMPDSSQLTITYGGVVSGDTFTGTVNTGFAQAPYTGTPTRKMRSTD